MPTHVRVSQTTDSRQIGQYRLKLKLAAVAYTGSRYGIDSDERLTRAAVVLLRAMAIEYVSALTGVEVRHRATDPIRHDDEGLRVAAIAYTSARHGVDGEAGLMRAGLALLCAAAIEYVESLTGADPSKRPVDPVLQIDGGV